MEGKVAVVTGGSRGIGLEIAEVFLQSGAKVAVLASSADSVAKALAHLQERYASPVMGVACNVADLEEVTAAMGKIEAELGPVRFSLTTLVSQGMRCFSEWVRTSGMR